MVFATSAKVADDQGRAPLLGETKRRAYLGGPALWSSDASVAPEGAGDGSRRVAPEDGGLKRARDGRVAPDLLVDETSGRSEAPRRRTWGFRQFASARNRRVAPGADEVVDEDVRLRQLCDAWVERLATHGRRNHWFERAWLVLDRLQGLGLVWEMAQAWPWPAIWLDWTRHIAWANLDVPATGKHGAGLGSTGELGRSVHGETDGFLERFAAPMVLAAALCVACDVALRSARVRQRCGAADAASELRPYDADAPRSWTTARVWAAGVATRLSMVLYGPLGLVVARLFHCERGFNGPSARSAAWRAYASDGGNQRLAADPAVGCFSNELLAFRTLLAPVGALCLVAVPWLAMRRAVGACAYASPTDHEKTLQRHEIEHVLGVDGGDAGALCDDRSYEVLGNIAADRAADRGATGRRDSDWDFAEVWLVAPYKRHAATREARMLLRKLGLLCCYAWLRGEHRAQGVAVLAVEAYFGLPQVIRRPFRDARSNEACIILELAALTNAVYAMMTAWGLRSAVVMDKEQSIALIAVNGLAAVLVLGVFCAAYRGDAPPRAATAVDRARSAHGATCLVDWVTVSRQARAAAVKASAWRPRCLAPTHVLERRMDDARRAWVEAKRRNCLLEGTVRESLDALVRAHQVCAETTMCVGGKWFAEDGDPFSRAASALKTRSEEKVLMKPRKRALLLKLLALRYFQQARDRKKGSAPRTSRRTFARRLAPLTGAATARARGGGRRRGAGGRRRGAEGSAEAAPRAPGHASARRARQDGRRRRAALRRQRARPGRPGAQLPPPRGDLGDVPEEGSYHEPDSSEGT
ncbi:hypothetical protein SO694_00022246 [Aureococcus anophagefferens]|uniref:Uncharacterized protein n=1 Tax=Aureococcus anophagefferens TaxID=44056 RepID=A0ABR1FT71_AURAN